MAASNPGVVGIQPNADLSPGWGPMFNSVEHVYNRQSTTSILDFSAGLNESFSMVNSQAMATMGDLQSFTYNVAPSRVIFGRGKLKSLPDEMARQNLHAPIILTTPKQAIQGEAVKAILSGNGKLFTEATMHTPTSVTNRALAYAKLIEADSIISIGGGSTIGLGKALSIAAGLPHICIPTTYAGSEMTPILGETVDGHKKTRSDPKILPGTVIYDVDLTLSLPTALSATSGVNAIAHAGK